jgi:hypothetical protein
MAGARDFPCAAAVGLRSHLVPSRRQLAVSSPANRPISRVSTVTRSAPAPRPNPRGERALVPEQVRSRRGRGTGPPPQWPGFSRPTYSGELSDLGPNLIDKGAAVREAVVVRPGSAATEFGTPAINVLAGAPGETRTPNLLIRRFGLLVRSPALMTPPCVESSFRARRRPSLSRPNRIIWLPDWLPGQVGRAGGPSAVDTRSRTNCGIRC